MIIVNSEQVYLVGFDESSEETEKGVGIRLALSEIFDALDEGVLCRFGFDAQATKLLLGIAQEVLEDRVLLVIFEVLT